MTKADERYYAAERRREARKQWNRKFLNNRKHAMILWKQEHPEGITSKNLKTYQAYMREADKKFKQEYP